MSAPREVEEVPFEGVSGLLLSTSKGFALVGGAIFIAMVCLSVVSIVGRKLWSAPINGDIELLQMGTGVAAAAFFPYCTMKNEHLRVEFFTDHLSASARGILDAFANVLLAVAVGLLAWRGAVQAHDLREAGEVTVMRNIEVWIPVACLVPSMALTAACAIDRAIFNLTQRRAVS